MTLLEVGGVGHEESNRPGAAFLGEETRLLDQFRGKIESGEVRVTLVPQPERRAASAATSFEERGGFVGEEALDQDALGFPQAEKVRRPRVMGDGKRIIEIRPDRGGGYFFRVHAARNMPLALRSCGQSVTRVASPRMGSGSSSGCATLKASATAVVSLRVSVQTA